MGILTAPLLALSIAVAPAPADTTAAAASPLAGITDIAVYVEPLAPEIEEQGITAGVVGAAVVARLKESGLSVPNIDATVLDPTAPTLHVDILTVAQEGADQVIYSIRVEFTQTVRLDRDPGIVVYRVPTWSIGGVAIGAREWRDSMLNDVRAYTDEFIKAYIAANPPEGSE